VTHRVVFAPEALDQLSALRRHISLASGPDIASSYVDRIITYCEKFETHPHRGTRRDDLLPGLRTIGYRRRVTIVFRVRDESVVIVGIFYGGKDVEVAFRQH